MNAERFARILFRVAGIYGLLILAPGYFMEEQVGVDWPPAITHPEYYYGFIGVALAWQVVFLIIAQDPLRYRPLMLAAVLEKLGFAAWPPPCSLPAAASPSACLPSAWSMHFWLFFSPPPTGGHVRGPCRAEDQTADVGVSRGIPA